MVIDVHCHVGYSARTVRSDVPRFSFEETGAAGRPGIDSYFSPRLLKRSAWFFVRRFLNIDRNLPIGEALDARIDAVYEQHWGSLRGTDRLVLLAFDEYRDDRGRVIGPAGIGERYGTDLYVSNTLVRAMCAARPDRYLFGASIHPYRTEAHRDACTMLQEVKSAGAVLIKWLPIHQNIRADDERTVAFLRCAAALSIPVLVHYGGEMSLSRQHMEFEHPGPMLAVLAKLRAQGAMPTVIVAHAATPSFPWQSAGGFRMLTNALLGEFRDAPLYADISALAAFGRTTWLRVLARRPELHSKLIWGSDFPIPVMLWPFLCQIGLTGRRQIAALDSWIEQDLALKRQLGFDAGVFERASRLLGIA